MILGYLCQCCNGVADRVTMLKYTKDGIDFRMGYACDECKDQFYKQHKESNGNWLFKDWTLIFDITDIKSVDLMAIYERKEEKLQKKF